MGIVKIALIPMSRCWRYAKWVLAFQRGHAASLHHTPISSWCVRQTMRRKMVSAFVELDITPQSSMIAGDD
jgi:hypothetical protein